MWQERHRAPPSPRLPAWILDRTGTSIPAIVITMYLKVLSTTSSSVRTDLSMVVAMVSKPSRSRPSLRRVPKLVAYVGARRTGGGPLQCFRLSEGMHSGSASQGVKEANKSVPLAGRRCCIVVILRAVYTLYNPREGKKEKPQLVDATQSRMSSTLSNFCVVFWRGQILPIPSSGRDK